LYGNINPETLEKFGKMATNDITLAVVPYYLGGWMHLAGR